MSVHMHVYIYLPIVPLHNYLSNRANNNLHNCSLLIYNTHYIYKAIRIGSAYINLDNYRHTRVATSTDVL